MKLLTFLGVGQYSETIYTWNGQEHLAKYAPIATANMVDVTSITVFLTEDAHQKIYPSFEQSVPANIKVNPIPVDLGKNEIELWKIFNAISQSVNPDEKVVFDITHGLRSFPLLGLLAAAFLRASQKVDLRHVFYGAYDVRDQSSTPNKTPIFDLTPMLALLDWTNATNRFVKTGDARDLAELMKEAADENQSVLNAAKSVNDVSMAAFLCQPMPLSEKSNELIDSLNKSKSILQSKVPPFELLREQIVKDFSCFVHPKDNFKSLLQAQLNLIRWYHKNNQLMQAMTLMREWLIGAVTYKLGGNLTLEYKEREEISTAINGLSNLKNKSKFFDKETHQKRVFDVSDLNEQGKKIHAEWDENLWKMVARIWSRTITDTRNQLNHAGYKKDLLKIDDIKSRADEAVPVLDRLAKDLNIIPQTP